jgi:hypothetical protein
MYDFVLILESCMAVITLVIEWWSASQTQEEIIICQYTTFYLSAIMIMLQIKENNHISTSMQLEFITPSMKYLTRTLCFLW